MAFKLDRGIKPFEKKIWLSSPTMHGEELKYMQEAYETKEVVWLIEDINKKEPTYLILGFLDDDPAKEGKDFYGYRILGGTEQLQSISQQQQESQ